MAPNLSKVSIYGQALGIGISNGTMSLADISALEGRPGQDGEKVGDDAGRLRGVSPPPGPDAAPHRGAVAHLHPAEAAGGELPAYRSAREQGHTESSLHHLLGRLDVV